MNKYEIRVIPKQDNDGKFYWTAFFPAVEACVGGGNTAEEAIKDAEENLEIYLEYLNNNCIPKPAEYQENIYGGKIALRTSKSTHKKLAEMAELEGTSINQLINSAIDLYLGQKIIDINFDEKINKIRELEYDNLKLNLTNTYIIHELNKNSKKQLRYIGE